MNEPEFERALVSQLASEFLKEQRRARRWSIFFKSLLALYLLLFLVAYVAEHGSFGPAGLPGQRYTALIDIEGVISADSDANADFIVSGLRAAFENRHTAGIILRINSPGGSPVQAGSVNDETR